MSNRSKALKERADTLAKWEAARDGLPADTPASILAYHDRVIDFMRNGEGDPARAVFAQKRREGAIARVE